MKITKTFFRTEIEVTPDELEELKHKDFGVYSKIKEFIKRVTNKR